MSDDLKSSTNSENKKTHVNFKMLPLILLYQLWVVVIIQAFGWVPAIPAFYVTAGWIAGWPKGVLKNLLFVFTFALVLPLMLVVALGIEPNVVPK